MDNLQGIFVRFCTVSETNSASRWYTKVIEFHRVCIFEACERELSLIGDSNQLHVKVINHDIIFWQWNAQSLVYVRKSRHFVWNSYYALKIHVLFNIFRDGKDS